MPTDLLRADIPPYDYAGTVKNTDPKQYTDFSPEFQLWITNFIDVFNENMRIIESKI